MFIKYPQEIKRRRTFILFKEISRIPGLDRIYTASNTDILSYISERKKILNSKYSFYSVNEDEITESECKSEINESKNTLLTMDWIPLKNQVPQNRIQSIAKKLWDFIKRIMVTKFEDPEWEEIYQNWEYPYFALLYRTSLFLFFCSYMSHPFLDVLSYVFFCFVMNL